MGATYSCTNTVVTTWVKHKAGIMIEVSSFTDVFLNKYCSLEPDDYTNDIHVIVAAFDEYISQYMAATRYEAYIYNTTIYTRFRDLVKKHPKIKFVRGPIVVGIKLERWPVAGYHRLPTRDNYSTMNNHSKYSLDDDA